MSDVIDPAAGFAALRDELTGLAARGEAVFLLDSEIRVLWATRAGAAFLGKASPDLLAGAPLDPAVVPVDHLRRLAADLAPSPRMRLERLRLTAGRRVIAATLALRKVELPSGPALLAVALEGPRSMAGNGETQPLPTSLFAPAETRPESSPAPVTVDVLRARSGGRVTARFTWQTAADGSFTAVSPELAGLLGEAAAPRPGETLADLSARGLVDPHGRLAAALASGATFNRLETLWPVPGADGLLPILLSASPVLDSRRVFGGFAGFGTARLEALVPAPPGAPRSEAPERAGGDDEIPGHEFTATTAPAAADLALQDSGPAQASLDAAGPDAAHPSPTGELSDPAPVEFQAEDHQGLVADPELAEAVVGVMASAEGLAHDDVAAAVPVQHHGDVRGLDEVGVGVDKTLIAEPGPIVPAADPEPRPEAGAAVQPSAPGEPVPQPGTVPALASKPNVVPLRSAPVSPRTMLSGITPGLSRSERHAFREIARALGARVEGDDDAPAADALPHAAAAALPPLTPTLPPDGSDEGAPAPETPVSQTASQDGSGRPAAATPSTDARRHANDDDDPATAATRPSDAALPVPVADPDLSPGAIRHDPLPAAQVPSVHAAEPDPEPASAHGDVAKSAPALAELVATTLAGGASASADPDAPMRDPATATLLDRLPIGILVSRGDVPIYMNRTLLEILGYEDADTFHREGGIDRLFSGAPSDQETTDDATVMIATRSGETVSVDARLQTIPWNGMPATLMSFRRAADFEQTQLLRAAELDLQRRGAEVGELRTILDTATDGVVILDSSGRIHAINRSGEALFGYDQNEVAGETFITLFAPDSHATALDYLEGLRSNGVASVMNDGREVVGRVRQGGRIPLFMTLGAISEGTERKFCAVLRDITPWKKAESELLEAKRAAEQASAQKSDFLAKISHEIRTPLSAIIGFAEVMIEERFGPVGNERYLEYLRDIHASGGHVISLVNDLLDLSKIEAGRFDLTFVSVDVNEVVSRSVAMMQPQAGSGRVVLRSSLSPRLPGVVADERSLRQIVLNILSNAVKFTDPGGQVIISTTFTDRGEVAIRVRDTGIGMTDKEIETALEPFRQIATARRAGGTGLGLPLTKALVEANRASLTIRSAKDAGTLVEVTFPQTRVLAE